MIERKALGSDPKALKLAFKDLGLKEVAGRKANPRVVEMFKASGNPGVTSDETAWCAAAVGAWLKEAGLPNTKSLAARSYMNWGKATKKPQRGDVVVFKRPGSSWSGHVALYLGEAGGRIYHIGGNQSNSVSIASTPKSKLLGYRTTTKLNPITGNSQTTKGVAAASMGGAVSLFGEQSENIDHGINTLLSDSGQQIIDIASFSTILTVVGVCLLLAGISWTVWARYNDWKKRGI